MPQNSNNPQLEAEILRQVMRFQNHPNFPADTTEIENAFRDVASVPEVAQKVGAQLMRTVHFAPVPADVYAAADAVREAGISTLSERNCGPRPGDEPFGGFPDLFDAELIDRFRELAEKSPHFATREAAKKIVQAWDERCACVSQAGAKA